MVDDDDGDDEDGDDDNGHVDAEETKQTTQQILYNRQQISEETKQTTQQI